MTVVVGPEVAEWWVAQWGPGGGETEEGYVVLRLDRPATDTDAAELQAVVDRVNVLAETRWLDLDGVATVGRGVVRVGRELVWEISSQHPDGPAGWLEALAADLSEAGWEGRVGIWSLPEAGPLSQLGDGERVPSAMVVIAWAGAGRYGPHPSAAAKASWRVNESVIPVVVDLALDVVTRYGPGANLVEAGVQSEVSDADLGDLLRTALREDQRGVSPLPWMARYTPDLNLAVSFAPRGHVLIDLHAPVDRLPSLVRDLTGSLATDSRVDADWMVLLENGRGSDFARAYELARETKLPDYYLDHRHQDPRYLPDAFAWQVVTDEHLSRARDLSAWRLTDLGDGRHVLAAPRLEEWMLPDPDSQHLRIAPGVLEGARRDFGAMIHPDTVR